MRFALRSVLLVFLVATAGTLAAKQSRPAPLPPWLLRARTVAVLIDPDAGVALEDPNGNQIARKDVEAALAQWGRFAPVLSTEDADLLIVVRRGHGRVVEPTVTDPRQNRRPGSVTTSDSGVAVGVQRGTPPFDPTSGTTEDSEARSPHTKAEIGGNDDFFAVYRGNPTGDNPQPLDSTPAWRVSRKDALKPHSVPAVEQFRKAVAEAEKAAAASPGP